MPCGTLVVSLGSGSVRPELGVVEVSLGKLIAVNQFHGAVLVGANITFTDNLMLSDVCFWSIIHPHSFHHLLFYIKNLDFSTDLRIEATESAKRSVQSTVGCTNRTSQLESNASVIGAPTASFRLLPV